MRPPAGNRWRPFRTALFPRVQAQQYLVEDRRSAPRPRAVEDRHHHPVVAAGVAAEAGEGAHGVEGAGSRAPRRPVRCAAGVCAWCRRGPPAAARRCTPLHRAVPGGLQHRRHLTGADPFLARQSRAVLHHQARRGDALARQPLPHHPLRGLGVVAVGAVAELRADGEEQLPGHGVVTVFVDVADDLDQVWREGLGDQRGVARYAALAVLAEDAAAQFLPDAAHAPAV